MAYTVFESSNMGTTHYNGKIFDAICETDVENGTFGYIEGMSDTDTIYTFKKGLKDSATIFVVDQPSWDEDNHHRTNQRKDKFINKAGVPFRIREVKKMDKFAVTIDGFTSASQDKVAKDVYVTIDTTTGKLIAKETTTADVPFEGIIESSRVSGGALVTTAHTYGHSATMYKVKVNSLV